ncbi:hypothetical protein H0H93_015573 [Arthromyces matolae]|nr:hypothetical protein H0H93_015573 [Arthromyces matolae]
MTCLALNNFLSPSDEDVDYERERGHDSWRSYLYPKPLSPSGSVLSAHYSIPTFTEPHVPLKKYSHSHHSASSSITNEGPEEMGVPIHKDRVRNQQSSGLLDPIGPPRQTGIGRYHDSMNRQPRERMPNIENDEKTINPPLYPSRSSAFGTNRPQPFVYPRLDLCTRTTYGHTNLLILPATTSDGSSSYPHVPPVPTPVTKSKPTLRKHPFAIGGPNPFRPAPPLPNDSSHSSFVLRRLVFDPFRKEDDSHGLERGVTMRNPAVIRGIKRLLADDNDDYNDYLDEKHPVSHTLTTHLSEEEEETEEADWHRRHRGTAEMAMNWGEGKRL